MVHRWVLAGFVIVALLASGCSSTTPTITTKSAKPSSSQASTKKSEASEEAEAPQDQLDADACVEVTSANLDLAVASDAAAAQKAVDVFKKYDPPSSVTEALDHFVETNGVQYDDPDYDKFNDRIDEWVHEVCPL